MIEVNYVNSNFIAAMIKTIDKIIFNLLTCNFDAPKYEPNKPPVAEIITIRNKDSFMINPLNERPINPEILFTKIKRDEMAAVCFISAQCNIIIRGLKIMPPPIPIIPEKIPINNPIINDQRILCLIFGVFSMSVISSNLITEKINRIAKIFL